MLKNINQNLLSIILVSLIVMTVVGAISFRAPNPTLKPEPIAKPVAAKAPMLPTLPESELPQGGRHISDVYRLIALYGTNSSPILGSLGEQDETSSISRIKKLAKSYQLGSKMKIMPTFEIIASVASSAKTEDKDYSAEADPSSLENYIDTANNAGVYVVLDLQPGLDDFLTQAKEYESLLIKPGVGLALDPEWRLKHGQKHLEQIGSVSSREVNATSRWLSQIVENNNLPEKLFLVHQFRNSMITQRDKLILHKNLANIIQMDGQGDQHVKKDSYKSLTLNSTDGFSFGWKNFYDEDHSMLNPSQTMKLSPRPDYVSYQ